jgi:hypothetical protein
MENPAALCSDYAGLAAPALAERVPGRFTVPPPDSGSSPPFPNI